MEKYIVKNGENIFDIAITLSGTIEGIWDLLISNDWLSVDTELKDGMVLEYHPKFVVNDGVIKWLRQNGESVKNGHHYGFSQDIDGVMSEMAEKYSLSNETWAIQAMRKPKIVVDQYGLFSSFQVRIGEGGFVVVDWGDEVGLQVYTSNDLPYNQSVTYIEHDYEDNDRHTIKIYGMHNIEMINFSELNGIYYFTSPVSVNEFVGNSASSEQLNELLSIN